MAKWIHSFYIFDQCNVINGNLILDKEHAIDDEVYDWLEENMKGKWRFLRYMCSISFEDHEDAMAFKLRWL